MTGVGSVRLGDADLGRQRHICGLFDGPEDAANALVPFILEGLQRGDRVIHVVEDRRAYLGRMEKKADVSAALESGQLDIRTWHDSYLQEGSFSASRMQAYIRRSLRLAPSLGFVATRLIGDMGWAQSGVQGVDELLAYEREINAIVVRPQTWVVCAYDVRRHSSSLLSAILAVHRAALVGGRLQRTPGDRQAPGPRERILAAASQLFAENGISRTGVDTLIEAADVAKATFYRHFPSKDTLIVAWLQDPRTRWFDRVRARAEAQAATPSEVVPRLFEAMAEWLETDDFVGCPYLNTAFEISDPDHPAREVVRDYLAEIGAYLEACVAALGQVDAARRGRELHTLLAGSISLAVANRTSSFALAARDAAVQLLDGQTARGRRTQPR